MLQLFTTGENQIIWNSAKPSAMQKPIAIHGRPSISPKAARSAISLSSFPMKSNYQELKSETQAQNSKIDYLAKTVEKLADVIVGSAAGLVAVLLAGIGFLLEHFVFK
jgi:hypothetical protein